jgi:hypothetical protein
MPRCATRQTTIAGRTAPVRGGVSGGVFCDLSRGHVFARRAAFLLSLSLAVFPVADAQHGGHGGGSQPQAPHNSAPQSHMSAPRPSQPSHPAYGGPSYGRQPNSAHPYRGVPPGYEARPTPYPGVAPNRSPVPRSFVPRPAYGPGIPYANAPRGSYNVPRSPYNPPPGNLGGPHLGTWLQSHQGQPLSSQENSLRREQGFNALPPQQQQRLIDRLHQLDAMPPEQRQRWVGRNENMERLSPERRQAVRGSVQELNNMDAERKQQVRAAYRVLRDMPPQQREHVLNSPAYRSMYSDHERQVLNNLLSVEPYTPH